MRIAFRKWYFRIRHVFTIGQKYLLILGIYETKRVLFETSIRNTLIDARKAKCWDVIVEKTIFAWSLQVCVLFFDVSTVGNRLYPQSGEFQEDEYRHIVYVSYVLVYAHKMDTPDFTAIIAVLRSDMPR